MKLLGASVGFVVLVLLTRLAAAAPGSCPTASITDSILGFRDSVCHANGGESLGSVVVVEGGEVSLQKALRWVYRNKSGYAAILFYASWCPFSRAFRPTFSALASLYPSIPHYAIEESAVRPSILSKYGVHGFPTLLLVNYTMRDTYGGSRTLCSLIAFYRDVTGMETQHPRQTVLDKAECLSDHEHGETSEPENCPFSWARSPENMLRQETYLALATAFVLLRLLQFCFPFILEFARFAWRWHIRNLRLWRLWERPMAYMKRATQLLNFLNYPSKRSNLQEGAKNARTWASKSLVSAVAIGDASTSRGVTIGQNPH